MKKTLSLIATLLTLNAQPVTFEWDHSPDPLVTGYRLYWGVETNVYTSSRGISRATNAITILDSTFTPNTPYFFTVVATNVIGIESLPSNVVGWTNIVVPSPVKNFRVVVVKSTTAP